LLNNLPDQWLDKIIRLLDNHSPFYLFSMLYALCPMPFLLVRLA
jgi:hypothetical protein